MSAFTPRQRDVLKRRLARAICWAQSETFKREAANYLAEKLVEDLEDGFVSAAAQRRAIANIADRMEQTA
jgi:hypothetical protein